MRESGSGPSAQVISFSLMHHACVRAGVYEKAHKEDQISGGTEAPGSDGESANVVAERFMKTINVSLKPVACWSHAC